MVTGHVTVAREGIVSFESMWAELQPVGRSAQSGGYQRFAWTRADHDLREWFSAESARLSAAVT